MFGKYDIKEVGGGAFFQTGSRALAMETGRGLSLREFGRLVRVFDLDGVTPLADFRCGQILSPARGRR